MLVGLTGLIGSGKTTVANLLVERHGYRADSFAASVKDALATIFGWPRLKQTAPYLLRAKLH